MWAVQSFARNTFYSLMNSILPSPNPAFADDKDDMIIPEPKFFPSQDVIDAISPIWEDVIFTFLRKNSGVLQSTNKEINPAIYEEYYKSIVHYISLYSYYTNKTVAIEQFLQSPEKFTKKNYSELFITNATPKSDDCLQDIYPVISIVEQVVLQYTNTDFKQKHISMLLLTFIANTTSFHKGDVRKIYDLITQLNILLRDSREFFDLALTIVEYPGICISIASSRKGRRSYDMKKLIDYCYKGMNEFMYLVAFVCSANAQDAQFHMRLRYFFQSLQSGVARCIPSGLCFNSEMYTFFDNANQFLKLVSCPAYLLRELLNGDRTPKNDYRYSQKELETTLSWLKDTKHLEDYCVDLLQIFIPAVAFDPSRETETPAGDSANTSLISTDESSKPLIDAVSIMARTLPKKQLYSAMQSTMTATVLAHQAALGQPQASITVGNQNDGIPSAMSLESEVRKKFPHTVQFLDQNPVTYHDSSGLAESTLDPAVIEEIPDTSVSTNRDLQPRKSTSEQLEP